MKYLIILIMFIGSLLHMPQTQVFAENKYARAINSTNLYKLTSNNELGNVICIVEKTYFVQIISETEDLFKVNYNGVFGYVKKNDVKEITNTPNTPYPTNIKLIIGSDCNLRSSPSIKTSTSNIICSLKSEESKIDFIGRIFSEEAIDFGGTTWYYVKYNGEYGYIYNKYIKSITPIYENTEQVNFLKNTDNFNINPLTHTPSLILIIILSIPCLVILLILYLPRKSKIKPKQPKKTKVIDRY